MMKKIIFGIFALVLITVNLSKNFENKGINYSLSQLLNVAAAVLPEENEPNWSYAQELVVKPRYDDVVEIEGGTKILLKNLPVGAEIVAYYYGHLVAQEKNCEFWLLARCDQNLVGIFPVNLN